MKNKKFKELSEYERKRLEIINECTNDIKEYEKQTEKILSSKVKKIILNMYLFGFEYNLSNEQVLEIYEKKLLK